MLKTLFILLKYSTKIFIDLNLKFWSLEFVSDLTAFD